MANRRQNAEKQIYEFVEAVLPGGSNKEILQARFAQMSDIEFEQLIVSCTGNTFSH